MKTILKIIIIAVLILNAIKVSAQDAIGISIYQDAKLATIKDDHGNSPFTPDLQFKITLQGNETNVGFLHVGVKYEWADLYGGDYSRFGSEVGYSFYTNVWGINVTPLVGYGYTYRFDERYDNFEYSLEIKVPIAKNLSIGYLATGSSRKELKGSPFRYNGAVGFEYKISTDYLGRQAKKGTRF